MDRQQMKFYLLSQSKYDELIAQKTVTLKDGQTVINFDAYALYFTTDTYKIYKGDKLFSQNVSTVTTAEINKYIGQDTSCTAQLEHLYIDAQSGSMYINVVSEGKNEQDQPIITKVFTEVGISAESKSRIQYLTKLESSKANKLVTVNADGNAYEYVKAIVTSIGEEASDANIPTEKAVKIAIDSAKDYTDDAKAQAISSAKDYTDDAKITVASMQQPDGTNAFSKLKIIGDCSVVYGANGLITLRIGPALNCSLFNGTDGISDATVAYTAPSFETATLSEQYKDNKFLGESLSNRKIVVNQDGDTILAKCGQSTTQVDAVTGDVTKGNDVHFEGANTGKFKVYINAYDIEIPFETDPITESKTYAATGAFDIYVITKDEQFVNDKVYYTKEVIDGDVSYTEASVTVGGEVTESTYYEKISLGSEENAYVSCEIDNFRGQPKSANGANGYCANVNFTFKPQNLFKNDVEFKVSKIQQIQITYKKDEKGVLTDEIESEAVVATWECADANKYVYLVDYNTLPVKPSTATYSLSSFEGNTIEVSGVTYLTTAVKMTPSATGLANIGYPGYVSNKLNCSYNTGNAWFTAFNATSTDQFASWTTKQNTTMNWQHDAVNINKGRFENPQIVVKGNNMHGDGTSITSSVLNNKLLVCDASGYVSRTAGFKDSDRYTSDTFANKFGDTVEDVVRTVGDLSATGNTHLQTYDGYILYPTENFSSYNMNKVGDVVTAINPDYSNCTGDRYAYLKLTKSGTIMSGTLKIVCASSPQTALIKDSNDKVGLKIEISNGNGAWMDIMGIGTTFSYGTNTSIGFSIPQSDNYGNGFMYCKITMVKPTSGAGIKISSVSL